MEAIIDPRHLADFLEASRRFFGLVERPRKRRLLALLASGTFALPMAPALGQFGGRRAPKGAGKRAETPSLEITLHELGEDLKLSPDQQPLFDRYASKVRALASDVRRDRKTPARGDVLARIEVGLNQARNRLTAMEDIADAAKALYAKLDEGQRPAADPRLATIMLIPLGAG